MAEKKTGQTQKKQATESKTKVTRIKAADSRAFSPKKTTKNTKSTKPAATAKKTAVAKAVAGKPVAEKTSRNPFKAILNYVKGAWEELSQVRWPNRRTTWSLTFAVIAFTAFFVALIVLLDYGFSKLFELILV